MVGTDKIPGGTYALPDPTLLPSLLSELLLKVAEGALTSLEFEVSEKEDRKRNRQSITISPLRFENLPNL